MADARNSRAVRRRNTLVAVMLVACSFTIPSATTAPLLHEVTQQFVDNLALQEQLSDPTFKEFSIDAGKDLYFKTFSSDEKPFERSCSSCHGPNPTEPGKHVRTGKIIDPIALSATPDRFTNAKKIRKNFMRNCKWVMGRECSTREKGNFLVFVTSTPTTRPPLGDTGQAESN